MANYVKDSEENIVENSPFSIYIFEKYIAIQKKENYILTMLDLGCGNMRDSIFFSKNGCHVYAIDKSFDENKNPIQNNHLFPITADVDHFLETQQLNTLVDIVYMRWFIHAVPYSVGTIIFANSIASLKPGGLICIEVRSYNDKQLKAESVLNLADLSYTTTHKQWLYGKERLELLAQENDVEILEMVESNNFSKTETSDPLLIRFIGRKKLINHFEKSSNYDMYANITNTMALTAKTCYQDLRTFNVICAKFNIKYLAVSGSALGLCRHGGIIPWDNDIDVGVTLGNWSKINQLRNVFEKSGLKYKRITNNQCHFGTMDIFLLVPNKNKFLCGGAGAMCHIAEYNSIAKQHFGTTYIYAAINSQRSLAARYKTDYFYTGDVNDNFHYKNDSVKRFTLDKKDRNFLIDFNHVKPKIPTVPPKSSRSTNYTRRLLGKM